MDTFSTRLRTLRKAAGYSQERLGQICGIADPMAIWKYESGRQKPQIKHLIAIADALNTSTDYLLGRAKTSYFIR